MSTTDTTHAEPILISVIVPCYQADIIRLRHCVDAILNQEGLATLIGTPNLNYLAGRIVLTFRKPKTPSLFELYDALFHLRQEIYVKEAHYGTTANLIAKKSLFEAVGLFDEQ